MIERIEHNRQAVAIIIHKGFEGAGVNFFTPEDNPLQLGVLTHKGGARIKPHRHKRLGIIIESVQEVLHVVEGKIQIDLYDDDDKSFSSHLLEAGDTILLISGAHGLKVLEDAKMIEVKQGPYRGVDKDKELLG
jgi:cupin fold WbuC family metalloprotein